LLFVFVANLARAAIAEADALAPSIGLTPYETRLALAAGPPSVLLVTADRDRASDLVAAVRSRGHAAHVFDDENLVTSEAMIRADGFVLDAEGMRRTVDGALLPYGDVYAILRAVHDSTSELDRLERPPMREGLRINTEALRVITKEERERVAYFFRRSGEKPWILRERHTSYVGLGPDRTPIAFANFTRTLSRMRESCAMAVYDDRLERRRPAERVDADGGRSSREGMDLLAHLLAMTIASQGGSPYR
jgi:hypothetical protein